MANRFIIQTGGVASGDCLTLGTGGTLAYVFGPTSPVVAGDTIYWCAGVAGATYDITTASQLLVRSATGTPNAHVTVQGCNSSGVVNGVQPQLLATGTWSTNISMFVIGTDAGANPLRYYDWKNIDWNANSTSSTTGSYNVVNNSGTLAAGAGTNTTAYYHTFMDCRLRNARHNGLSFFTGGVGTEVDESFTFVNCEVSGCGVFGSGSAGIGRGVNAATWVMDRCRIVDNQNGLQLLATSDKIFRATGCDFSRNLSGAGLQQVQMDLRLYGCNFESNAGYGLFGVWKATNTIERCRFIGNTTAGISDLVWDGTQTTSPYNRNAFFGNTANFTDSVSASITPPGQGNVFRPNFPPRRGIVPARAGVYA